MIYCLQDNNGSGKTLFFDDIFLNNRDIITYFTNETVINPELFVREVISIFGSQKIDELYRIFNIKDILAKKISFLSSGEVQSLKLYITFLDCRDNIILDEPTSFIDESKKIKFYKYLSENINKKTVIITLHSKNELEILSDKIYTLDQIKELYEENNLLK